MEICKSYCGYTCVNGACPVANMDEYMERGYDIIHSCDECPYYKGCEDCCFGEDGYPEARQYCPKRK